MPDFSLFPKNEEWGTGDEALDLKLGLALKKAQQDLSLDSIRHFYQTASAIKTRAFNPSFLMFIEMVTKALLHLSSPKENVYNLMSKLKGNYEQRQKVSVNLSEVLLIKNELITKRYSRYHGQVDFFLQLHAPVERNPFLKEVMFRGNHSLQTKMIFKELKLYLNGESGGIHDNDPLLKVLAQPNKSAWIEGLAQIWHDQGQLFTISLINEEDLE